MHDDRFGTCPWCGKHNAVLTFVIGSHGGKLYSDWICYECLEAKRAEDFPEMHKEVSVNGR